MKLIFLLHFIVGCSIQSDQAQGSDISDICKTSKFRNDSDCESAVNTNNFLKGNSVNLYESMVYLYDHFHWNKNTLEKGVSKACRLDMEKYLYALNDNEAWAIKGKQHTKVLGRHNNNNVISHFLIHTIDKEKL